jgi:hypothetical protein
MEEQAAIDVAVEVLQERGPGLGRPFVDTVKGSRHANMKELRPRGGFIRILFARSTADGHLARGRGQARSLEFLVRGDDSGGRSVIR